MAENPHFSLPFRFAVARTGEQYIPVTEDDSIEEVGDCVELIVRTERGQRRTDPDFGRPEPLVFTTDRELIRSMIHDAIEEGEPRVRPIVEGEFDPADPGQARIVAMYELELPGLQSLAEGGELQ